MASGSNDNIIAAVKITAKLKLNPDVSSAVFAFTFMLTFPLHSKKLLPVCLMLCGKFLISNVYLSPTYSVCSTHGYLQGNQGICPECGKETEVYSRITGYYRPVKNWNVGKSQEFKERKTYDIRKAISDRNNANVCIDSNQNQVPEVKEILLFYTKTCPNCKMAKMMLDKAGIAYNAIDAEDNADITRKFNVVKAPTMIVPTENGNVYFDNASKIKGYIESRN